jgi:hypothetical protein
MFLSEGVAVEKFFRTVLMPLLAIWLLSVAGSWAQGQQPSVPRPAPSSLPALEPKETRPKHVVDVVGLSDIKHGTNGGLASNKSTMLFRAAEDSVTIPRPAIPSVWNFQDNVELVSANRRCFGQSRQ